MVGAPGFEPGASCAQGRRATRLRYAPTSTRDTCPPILSHPPQTHLLSFAVDLTFAHTHPRWITRLGSAGFQPASFPCAPGVKIRIDRQPTKKLSSRPK